jgi:hypothetical protein
MTAAGTVVDLRLDRSMRRLGCLARLEAARTAAQRRRRATAADLEVLVRRAESEARARPRR